MIQKFFLYLVLLLMKVPFIKKLSWKIWYDFLAKHLNLGELRFMNYGYSGENYGPSNVPLAGSDEADRNCIQLYHHVAASIDVKNKRVMEVGSGRGGGAWYVQKYLGAAQVTGLDLSDNAVKKCNALYHSHQLNFVQGSAEKLPFESNQFDAVLNVESSHCYPSVPAFLAEVKRVLKPGGSFLYTDFRPLDDIQQWELQLQSCGLGLIKQEDITDRVLEALKIDSERKEATIRAKIPRLLQPIMIAFSGTINSKIYKGFKKRTLLYKYFVLQKES